MRSSPAGRRAAALACLLGLAACGGADSPAPAAPAASAPAPAPAPGGPLARAEVEAVLASGPRWVIRQVVPEPVLRDGKFAGWRLPAVPESWERRGLRAGDVVSRVNGVLLEKPEDVNEAWLATYAAKEIRIDLERDGAPQSVVLPIEGPPREKPPENAPAPAPAAESPPGLRGTVVIEGDDRLDAERASD